MIIPKIPRCPASSATAQAAMADPSLCSGHRGCWRLCVRCAALARRCAVLPCRPVSKRAHPGPVRFWRTRRPRSAVEQSDLCAHGADHRRPAQRCHEVELPWSGHRQVRQHQWGFNSFYWDSTTNIRTDIPAPIGGLHPSVTDIGNNGNVIGSSEMNDGTRHAFKWTLGGGSVDLGTLPGARTAEPSHSARTDAIWQAAAKRAQGRIYTQSCRTSAHRNCMNHLCSNRKWSIL